VAKRRKRARPEPAPEEPKFRTQRPRLTAREQEALAVLRDIEQWHIERGERDDPHVAALTDLIRRFQ